MASTSGSENATLGSFGVFVSASSLFFRDGASVQDVPSPRTPDVPSPHTPPLPPPGHWWYAWDSDKA